MKVGIPKELIAGEQRVAAVPDTIVKMIKAGFEVLVGSGAGEYGYWSDHAYENVGAKIEKNPANLFSQADIILKVQAPTLDSNEIQLMKKGSILIGFLSPLLHQDIIQPLNDKNITTFSLDFLPRIARAQTMDVLSSMSNIAGYKSVILAASHLGKFFPMLTTAAGSILPAKVLVIGAGVAGLQAIATARRLGGVVIAMDTRPVVAEQIKSLGAEFASLEVTHREMQDTGGYATELPPEFYKQEQDIIQKHIIDADVVITSAQIPGKRAPLLITEQMVMEMKPGSVIVDLAAENKGNCAILEAGKVVVKHGVTIVGTLNIPSTLPIHASYLYARNLWAFLDHLVPNPTEINFDMTDEIIQACLITHGGETVNPTVKKALGN